MRQGFEIAIWACDVLVRVVASASVKTALEIAIKDWRMEGLETYDYVQVESKV